MIKPVDNKQKPQSSQPAQSEENPTIVKTYAIATSHINKLPKSSSKSFHKRNVVQLTESDLPSMKVKV